MQISIFKQVCVNCKTALYYIKWYLESKRRLPMWQRTPDRLAPPDLLSSTNFRIWSLKDVFHSFMGTTTVITRKQWNRKTTLQQYLIKFILQCYKANSFTRHLKNFLCAIGLFTLHNCCVSWLLNFLKLKLDSQCRLPIPEFSGYHCI